MSNDMSNDVVYFKKRMQDMSAEGLKNFLRELRLEYVRRGIRRLSSTDLRSLIVTASSAYAQRNAPPILQDDVCDTVTPTDVDKCDGSAFDSIEISD